MLLLSSLFDFISLARNNPCFMDSEWFKSLVDDCKAISVEYGFTSRWSQIEGRHELGKRILEENDNFKRQSIYGLDIVNKVSKALGIGARTIQYAVQFAQKYPDLSDLPCGKDATWTRIIREYLPENPIKKEITFKKCPNCGSLL